MFTSGIMIAHLYLADSIVQQNHLSMHRYKGGYADRVYGTGAKYGILSSRFLGSMGYHCWDCGYPADI